MRNALIDAFANRVIVQHKDVVAIGQYVLSLRGEHAKPQKDAE